MRVVTCTVAVLSASLTATLTKNVEAFTSSSISSSSTTAFIIPSLTNRGSGDSSRLYAAFEDPEEVQLDAEERMSKSIASVKQNLLTIRTGRANPSILDLVQVDYYG